MIEMSVQTRTYFVLGVMFACFAILYPKIFHPMILSALGWNRPVASDNEYLSHPRDRMVHRPGGPGPGPGGPGRPHPGMRMGGEGTPSRSTGGGRGGIMSMVLPIYAVGIVLYLIYTLVKVFGGNSNSNEKTKERKEAILREYYRNFHYDADKGKFRLGRNSDDDLSEDELEDGRRWGRNGTGGRSGGSNGQSGMNPRRNLPRDLERLLRKVDDKNITETEMRELRDRLEETERQMTRILEAMKDVQSRVDPAEDADIDEKCDCSAYRESGEYKGAKLREDQENNEEIENLTTTQPMPTQQEIRRRKRGEGERRQRPLDSSESEGEEYMDLDDGYEAEADEKDEEFRPRQTEVGSRSRNQEADARNEYSSDSDRRK